MNPGVWWGLAALAGIIFVTVIGLHNEPRRGQRCRCGTFPDANVHITTDRVHTPRACPTHTGITLTWDRDDAAH